jgi:hypothetical protein
MAEVKVCFHKIDSWGRPVFKVLDKELYYGSVIILPDSEEELNSIVESDLVFFGHKFDCEPMGSIPLIKLIIVRD